MLLVWIMEVIGRCRGECDPDTWKKRWRRLEKKMNFVVWPPIEWWSEGLELMLVERFIFNQVA